jgi:hypothetical protein
MHAMGDDHVSPMQTNSTSGGGEAPGQATEVPARPVWGAYRLTGKDAAVNLNEERKVVTAWARSKAG